MKNKILIIIVVLFIVFAVLFVVMSLSRRTDEGTQNRKKFYLVESLKTVVKPLIKNIKGVTERKYSIC
jgi:hypothetical protein